MTMAIRIMMKIRMIATLATMTVTMAMRIVMTKVKYVGHDVWHKDDDYADSDDEQ